MNIPIVLNILFRRSRVNSIIVLNRSPPQKRNDQKGRIKNCKYNVYNCDLSKKCFNSSVFCDYQSYISKAIIHTSTYPYKSNNNYSDKHNVDNFSKKQNLKKNDFQKIIYKIQKENIWTIPNFLCVARIGLCPAIAYFVVSSQMPCAFWLFLFAAFTDVIDGIIARKVPGQSSTIGSFLDPLADKVMAATAFLSLTWVSLMPYQLTILVIARDIFLTIAALCIRYKSIPSPKTFGRYFDVTYATAQLSPTFLSKMNSFSSNILVCSMLAAPVIMFPSPEVLTGLCWLSAFMTISSGVQYMFSKNTYKYLRNIEKRQKE